MARIDSSCSCTLASVPEDPTPPGKETRVTLEWTARASAAEGRQFRQWARLRTNDPEQSELRLVVQGELSEAAAIIPWEIAAGRVAKSERRSLSTEILVYRAPQAGSEPFAVKRVEFSDPLGEQCLTVTHQPCSDAELAARRGVVTGRRVMVTLRPGLPAGPFRQRILLHTNLADVEPFELRIVGEIVDDVHWSGRDYNPRTNSLNLGRVAVGSPLTKSLDLVVFRETPKSLLPKIVSATPPFIKATFQPVTSDPESSSRRVKLVVELPSGWSPDSTPTASSPADPFGMIEVETGHPDNPRLKLLLKTSP